MVARPQRFPPWRRKLLASPFVPCPARLPPVPSAEVEAVFSPADPDVLWLWSVEQDFVTLRLFHSRDGGRTLRELPTAELPPEWDDEQIVPDPLDPASLYIGTRGRLVWAITAR